MGIGGLDTALSGLRVAQQQLNIIASNVSNVNTEGYSRKILPQNTVVVDGASAGARTNAVIRNVDLNLERDFWTQVSQVNALEVKAKYLDRIQKFHGPPDLEVSVAAELAELRDVFAALSDSPEDNFLQRQVVDQAGLIATKINDLSGLLTEMRNDTQEELETSINSINEKLIGIAQINGQIKFNLASGKTVAELQDQRDQLIKELSYDIDVSFFTRGDGVLVVQTKTGVQLADERAETLFFNRTPVGPDTYYPDPGNVEYNGIFVGGSPADNEVTIDITQSGLNGKVGALLELRDQILPQHQAMLDELAHKMALRFEEQGLTLFTDASGHVPRDSTALLTGAAGIDPVTRAGVGSLAAAGGPAWTAGVNDEFTITLNAGGASPVPQTLTINLSAVDVAYPAPPANGAQALVNYINDQIALLPDAFDDTVASLDVNGQINIASNYNITLGATNPGQMGNAGLVALFGRPGGTEYAAPKTSPLTPVSYVGFSAQIRVNQAVLSDNRLVQQGTVATDIPVQNGSNEVIRRVIQFVFGDTEFQEAVGSVDLRSSTGGTNLQNWLGIYSQNNVTGTVNLRGYSDVTALLAAGGDTFTPPSGAVLDQFTITFDDPRTGVPAQRYVLDLEQIQAAFPIGGAITNAADQIAAAINALPLPGATAVALPGVPAVASIVPPDPAFAVQASVNAYGQLVINSRANVTIDASFPNGDDFGVPPADGGMRDEGLAFLGLAAGTQVTTDPYIDVQVGNDPPTRITIEPDDDETDLFNKLNKISGVDFGVPGLAVDDDLIDPLGRGTLLLRPGDDSGAPSFGGDLKIVGGPFSTDGSGVIPGGIAAGTSLIAALFGSDGPVQDVPHEVATGTGTYEAFRRSGLGPNATIDTGIISSTNLIDYAQKLVNRQTAESISIDNKITDETAFRDLLQRRLMDESGVNLEEELSTMILIQTAFAAAARVVSAIDEEFQELLSAFR